MEPIGRFGWFSKQEFNTILFFVIQRNIRVRRDHGENIDQKVRFYH